MVLGDSLLEIKYIGRNDPPEIHAIFFASSMTFTHCEYWTHSDGGKERSSASVLDTGTTFYLVAAGNCEGPQTRHRI